MRRALSLGAVQAVCICTIWAALAVPAYAWRVEQTIPGYVRVVRESGDTTLSTYVYRHWGWNRSENDADYWSTDGGVLTSSNYNSQDVVALLDLQGSYSNMASVQVPLKPGYRYQLIRLSRDNARCAVVNTAWDVRTTEPVETEVTNEPTVTVAGSVTVTGTVASSSDSSATAELVERTDGFWGLGLVGVALAIAGLVARFF